VPWRPLADQISRGSREERRVLGDEVLRGVAAPEAVEVVDLLAER
jgi:hypothetical protein